MSTPPGFKDKEAFIWKIADDLRGSFKAHEYGSFILPFVLLRRLECELAPTKEKVITKHKSLDGKIKDIETILCKESGHSFYNTSPLDLQKITEADRIWFEQQQSHHAQNQELREVALANDYDNFAYFFEPKIESELIERHEANEDLFKAFFNQPDFRRMMTEALSKSLYNIFNSKG